MPRPHPQLCPHGILGISKCKLCTKEKVKRFHEKHGGISKYFSDYNRRKTKEYRARIFKFLGNKCVVCGFDDKRALQIDHVDNKVGLRRRGMDLRTYYKRILQEIKNGSKDYQILCANCNWIKRSKKKEVTQSCDEGHSEKVKKGLQKKSS